ncbi:MAG: hypothetical protein RMJ66_06685 [Bacteroidia bacterium]|nr:hypothetical protein [Bacteroidia bacterium]MDW8134738.1 hypothetical protein [Bacteroidia bacterium]
MALVALHTRRLVPLLLSLLWGQLTLNPHSGYGIGLPYLTSSAVGLGMGRLSEVGMAACLPEQPAHSAHLTAMQADFSGYGRQAVLFSPSQRAITGSGGLQNLQLSFTRGRGWGFSLGLVPQAIQGYFSSAKTNGEPSLFYTEKTEGILSQAYLQVALRWKSFAVGYHYGYLWGNYERQRSLLVASQTYADYLSTRTRLSAYQHRLGLLWQDTIEKAIYQFSFTYILPTSFRRQFWYIFQKNFSLTNILLDTLAYVRDSWRYVGGIRGGVCVGFPRVSIGLEAGYGFRLPRWEGPGLHARDAKPSQDIRLGVEYIPDPRSPYFYRRLRYQVGGFWFAPPYAQLSVWGITGGVGWQFLRTPNLVYLAIERGWLPHPTVSERYLQLSIGVVFRELWFVPPRID